MKLRTRRFDLSVNRDLLESLVTPIMLDCRFDLSVNRDLLEFQWRLIGLSFMF